ncbi:hypothetical protein [Oceanospirillum beijerinckii]|uniref:hypothetical protein n=1 Tax=Oceanospirillum beijerinckii TaxID=64976 RepID=UPI0004886D74|nr:hypothetical protein [Oceanospirillum beijerinckii]MAC48275.1 hypothetical protein [Oceanospirillum sp.]
MKIRTLFTALFSCVLSTLPATALSDISLTYQSVATPEHKSTVLVNQNYIRFENPMTPDFFMLYDVKRQRMTLVDSDRRSYTYLDKESLESLSEQIEVTRQAIIAELKAGMKTASPEEKSQMAEILQQLKELALAPSKQLVRYIPMDKTQTINGYQCQLIQALVKNDIHATLCAIDAKQAKISAAEMATLKSFHHFSNSVHQQLNPGDATELLFIMNSEQQLPVSIERHLPASVKDEYHLIEVKQLQLSPDAFKVPQGYEIQDIENAFIVE